MKDGCGGAQSPRVNSELPNLTRQSTQRRAGVDPEARVPRSIPVRKECANCGYRRYSILLAPQPSGTTSASARNRPIADWRLGAREPLSWAMAAGLVVSLTGIIVVAMSGQLASVDRECRAAALVRREAVVGRAQHKMLSRIDSRHS
jgi:hypothetical protein